VPASLAGTVWTSRLAVRSAAACWLSLFVAEAALGGAEAEPAGGARYRIEYATYLGGSAGEQLREVIPLPDGSVLVGGQTSSPDLPVTPGVVQPDYGGEPAGTGHAGIYGGDCFVVRLSADGAKVLAATYFGGSKQERNVYGMALDRGGNVIISSGTRSVDLPTTPGCFRSAYGGRPQADGHDGFVAKLTPDLRRVLWCTYLGGCWPRGGIGLDAQENVYVVGGTDLPGFPVTPGTLKRGLQGRNATVQKLKSDGSGLVWSTLLGGTVSDGCMGVRVGPSGDVYVCGHTKSPDFPVSPQAAQRKHGGESDSYAARFSGDAKKGIYATFLGGQGNEFSEHRLHLAADGSVLFTGVTSSPDFPTTPGAFQRSLKGENDGFVARLSPDGTRFVFSTLLGGSGTEFYLMPTPDRRGNIWIVGTTKSADFPVTSDALQLQYGGGAGWDGDGALAALSTDGSRLLYATYLGGGGADLIRSIALGPNGEMYLVGSTSSRDFPVTDGAVQGALKGPSDGFVVKLSLQRQAESPGRPTP